MRTLKAIVAAVRALNLGGYGYNPFRATDEQVKASCPEIAVSCVYVTAQTAAQFDPNNVSFAWKSTRLVPGRARDALAELKRRLAIGGFPSAKSTSSANCCSIVTPVRRADAVPMSP